MNIYRNKKGLISFKEIPSNIKYNNTSLFKIINNLLVNNSIKDWEEEIKDTNNVCINNDKILKQLDISDNKYLGIGGHNDELIDSSYVYHIVINENNKKNVQIKNGLYNYIITYDKNLFTIHMFNILPFEIFTKHINLLIKISEKYKKVKILGSGECKITNDTITFNLNSGHVMRKIMKDSYYNITKTSYAKNNKEHIKYWWEPLISFVFKKLLSNYTNNYVSNRLIHNKDQDIDLFNKLLSKYDIKDNIKIYKSENNCLNDKNGNYL